MVLKMLFGADTHNEHLSREVMRVIRSSGVVRAHTTPMQVCMYAYSACYVLPIYYLTKREQKERGKGTPYSVFFFTGYFQIPNLGSIFRFSFLRARARV